MIQDLIFHGERRNKMDYIKEFIPVIKNLSQKIIHEFSCDRNIEEKSEKNYVTDLDFKIQEDVIEAILQIDPTANFISEEMYNSRDYTSYWIIDPIDGTTNLIHKYDSICISVARVIDEITVFGCVACPNTGEIFYAIKDSGAFLLKSGITKRITVSNNVLQKSLVGFGFPYDRTKIPALLELIDRTIIVCDDMKRKGPASLDMCYVACGRLDAYFELDLQRWDYAAGQLIVNEAGGKTSVVSNEKLMIDKIFVASNSESYNDVAGIVSK